MSGTEAASVDAVGEAVQKKTLMETNATRKIGRRRCVEIDNFIGGKSHLERGLREERRGESSDSPSGVAACLI